jgi:hypothetical protein
MKYIINKSWVFLAYFCIYILIVNIFDIGEEMYVGGLKTGYYILNGLYIPTFSILFIIYNLKYIENKKKIILNIIFILMTIIILILLLKRTLLLILIIGIILYLLKNISIFKILKVTIWSIIGLFILTYFSNNFNSSLKSRETRFSNEYDVTKENRFVENEYIFKLLGSSVINICFGSGEVFNDRVYISKYFEKEREAHNSFIRIFWNGGFLGLFVFCLIYFKQFNDIYINYKVLKTDKKFNNLLYFILVFIALRFINDFSSGITYLNYNAFSYFIIGGIMRISIEKKNSKKLL